jgi:archaellum component FlaC
MCKVICGKVLQFKNKSQKPNFNRLLKDGDIKTNLTIQLANLYCKEVQKRQLKNAGGGGSSEELEILTDQIEEYKNAISRSKEHIVKMKEKIKRLTEERKGYESVIEEIKMREEKMSNELSKFKDKLKQAERIMWENRKNIDYEFVFYGEGQFDMSPEEEDEVIDDSIYGDLDAPKPQGTPAPRFSLEFATEEEYNEYWSDENVAKRQSAVSL